MPPTDSRSWRGALLLSATLALIGAACGTSQPTDQTTTSPDSPPLVADHFDVQGHRGARGLQPENTLPAFETALDLGVSTLEFDLHFTADEEVVVWHDAVLDPSKCGLASDAPAGTPDPDDPAVPAEHLMIRSLTSEQLTHYRCDRNPDPGRFADQSTESTALASGDYSIVTLGRLLDFVAEYTESAAKTDEQQVGASDVLFNMETKRKPKDPENIGDGFDGVHAGPFELRILDIIAERDLEERVVIQSFDLRSLWAVHDHDPTIVLSALTKGGSIDFEDIAARGASIWSSDYRDLTESTLASAHGAGLEVIPWTVNEPDVMADLISMGVDGLITDRPDLLVAVSDPRD